MTEIRRISRKEATATEVLDVVERGGRVIIELTMLGRTMELAIRETEGTYYCDTPVKLLAHESRDELRECLERFNLVRRPTQGEESNSKAVAGS